MAAYFDAESMHMERNYLYEVIVEVVIRIFSLET